MIRGLKQPAQSQCGEQQPQDLEGANEHDQDLEQVGEPPVANEFLDEIEAERADHDDDQHVDQEQKHRFPLVASTIGGLWQQNLRPSRSESRSSDFSIVFGYSWPIQTALTTAPHTAAAASASRMSAASRAIARSTPSSSI